MEFLVDSRYGSKRFVGFGGMGDDQILRVDIPGLGKLVHAKTHKWSKDAANQFVKVRTSSGSLRGWSTFGGWSDNAEYEKEWTSSSEKDCQFPLANIFVIIPAKKSIASDLPLEFNVRKIYTGKPKWYFDEENQYGDYAGEAIAELFRGNYLSVDGNKCVVVYDEECNGAYSSSQEEYILENKDEFCAEDYDCDKDMFVALRKEDVKGFLMGSGSSYTTSAPNLSDNETCSDY